MFLDLPPRSIHPSKYALNRYGVVGTGYAVFDVGKHGSASSELHHVNDLVTASFARKDYS
jgi:hypothetical protein